MNETLAYIAELTDRMHVTLELGLQTTFEETSELINRAHSYQLFVETVQRIRKLAPKAEIVAHLINGLPGETHEMMLENVRRCVTDNDIDGINSTATASDDQYPHAEGFSRRRRLQLLSQDEYVRLSATSWKSYLTTSSSTASQVTPPATC